jgi:glycosyltransferase involved in cell wall biosynthesis
MNVLHVSTPFTWRGGEQQAAYLASALQQLGVKNLVLCPSRSALAHRLNGTEVDIAPYFSRGFMGLSLARRIAAISRMHPFDVVHTHDAHSHSSAVLAATLFAMETPIVVSRRVDFPVSNSFFSKWKYNHSAVKKIICVSNAIQEMTAPAIKDSSKLCVVHSGIDTSRYADTINAANLRSELGLSPNTPLIGNLSALSDHKDYPTFINVAEEVIKQIPEARFVIAGTGPDERMIRQLIHSKGLDDRVFLLGFRNDVPEVMKSLEVFLITSKTEGLGTIVLEAFAAGAPVVATAAGGIPELVEHEITGLLSPVGDVKSITQNVIRVLQDKSIVSNMTAGATQKAERFSFRMTAIKTLEVYRQVSGKKD